MNCSFNIRYKPRTTREYTKSDLTVYDSAGNTALNALTVYGKSEVVDGSIKSAGEGWAVVDLGTLTWTYDNEFYTNAITAIKAPELNAKTILCYKYNTVPTSATTSQLVNKDIMLGRNQRIYIKDTDYTDATAFKNSLNGVILAYKQATPTNNIIAVKTDDGTGIDGTMATFSTGTPLRGIPDTDVRDVMAWNGSAGTVIKNCAKIRLADLTWAIFENRFYTSNLRNIIAPFVSPTAIPNILSNQYITTSLNNLISINKSITVDRANDVNIRDTDYTTLSDFVASLGDAELVYELATPTIEQLTSTENASIAGLRTFAPQTHAQNNAQTDMTVNYTIRVPTI